MLVNEWIWGCLPVEILYHFQQFVFSYCIEKFPERKGLHIQISTKKESGEILIQIKRIPSGKFYTPSASNTKCCLISWRLAPVTSFMHERFLSFKKRLNILRILPQKINFIYFKVNKINFLVVKY